jgi:hypothetical protein
MHSNATVPAFSIAAPCLLTNGQASAVVGLPVFYWFSGGKSCDYRTYPNYSGMIILEVLYTGTLQELDQGGSSVIATCSNPDGGSISNFANGSGCSIVPVPGSGANPTIVLNQDVWQLELSVSGPNLPSAAYDRLSNVTDQFAAAFYHAAYPGATGPTGSPGGD